VCAPPPPAHASCSQGALQIALPAKERVVARGELEKARSQERGATARCATLVAEDCLRAPRTRGARAQPAKTAAAATVGRSPRTWRVAAQRAACLSGESCVRARRATEKRETNAEALCRRPKQAHCARANELDGVGTGGIIWSERPTNTELPSLWNDKLGPSLVRELWVTPDTDAGAGSEHAGQYVCTLAELMQRNSALFPLLKDWEPASNVS
jgi:hypothetical protein